MNPKVLVMLATYNGEKYLKEQINSILNQKNVDVYIRASDDLSTDNTLNILSEYKNKYSNFDFTINEKNKGFTYNFLDLIYISNDEFDYYAFCDQDDVWLDNKLSKAIEKIQLENNKSGILYCSNLKLVDKNLKEYGLQEKKSILNINRYCGLTSNIATGCTCVFDKKLFLKVKKYYPNSIYLHDYWIYLIAQYTGTVVYDYNSYILYRQHENNQIGSNKKFFTKSKISNFFHPKHKTSDLLKKFLFYYEKDIYSNDLKYVKIAANYNKSTINKVKLLFSIKIKRRKYNVLFKIKVLLNKF